MMIGKQPPAGIEGNDHAGDAAGPEHNITDPSFRFGFGDKDGHEHEKWDMTRRCLALRCQ